jgi:hypothetical protein
MTDTILQEALEAFEMAEEAEDHNRKDFIDDLRFARLGEQWPESIKKSRDKDGRPCLTINRLPAFIRQVVNDARQNKPSIVVHPADSNSDPETAEIINGLIRNIEQSSNAEVAYDTALDFAVTAGFGYFRINTRYAADDTFEQELVIERVSNPLSVYGDPNSTAADSSDWDTAFVVNRIPKDTFKSKYKGADEVDWEAEYVSTRENWQDEETIQVAEYWRREEVTSQIVRLSSGIVMELAVYTAQKPLFDALGVTVVGSPRDVTSHKVKQHLITGAEVLETIDWAGRYIPIVPVYGDEVMVEGKRYLRSLVRDAKDVQRRYNYHSSAVTELVALAPKAPWVGRVGSFSSDPRWETANQESHAYLEYDGNDKPDRQPFAGVPVGEMQQALMASDDMKAVMGLHDASMGQKSNETSGRAIMARQREGDVSTFHYIDNLSRAIRHAGRILIDLIPKVYGTARVVRILGPEGETEAAQVNQRFVPEAGAKVGQPTEAEDDISKIYDLRLGRYDLSVKAGPSFTSRREEAANQMIELVRAFPAAAPLIGDLLARNLDWPGADEIADRMKALLPPQVQQAMAQGDKASIPSAVVQQQMQQAQAVVQQLQQALQAAQQEMAALKQDRSIEARKLEIEAYKAETERQQVEAERYAPLGVVTA